MARYVSGVIDDRDGKGVALRFYNVDQITRAEVFPDLARPSPTKGEGAPNPQPPR